MERLLFHCKVANEDAKNSCEKQFAQWFILLRKIVEYQKAMSISNGQQQVLHYSLMCNGLNLGSGLNNYQYIDSYCQTMCLKPNPRVLVVVKCTWLWFHLVHCHES
jgi:hypothetical protein